MPEQAPKSVPRNGDGRHFSHVLESLAASVTAERVSLESIGQFTGRRSLSAFQLILALPMALPIPTPGLSIAFGIPLIVISGQLLLGRHSVWLPAWLARRSIDRTDLVMFVERALPKVRALEKVIHPRVGWMAGDWVMMPVGAICLVLAVIITLPIPLGHVVPGSAISVLALGMIERDGLAISIGLLVALLGILIVVYASTGLAAALQAWLAF